MGCHPGKLYTRYDRLGEHWNATHVPTRTLFKCTQCKFQAFRSCDARRHGKICGTQHVCQLTKVLNINYRRTDGVMKPRFPTKEERNARKEEKKKKESLRRREELDTSFRDLYLPRFVELDYIDDL